MRSRHRHRYNLRKAAFFIIIPLVSAAVLIVGSAAYVFSELSSIIDKNGLLLADLSSSETTEYVEAISKVTDSKTRKVSSIWLMPDAVKKVSAKSNDGYTLSALMYKQIRSFDKWVILVHGYSTGKESMQEYAEEYYKRGYNVLMPDLRAHGQSEGDFIGMGWLDRLDILAWVNGLIEEYPECQIVLHGLSMGAAAVMMTTGEILPSNIKSIIEDSGYTSVWDILKFQLNEQYKLPAFPVMYGASLWSANKWGYNWKDASAIKMLKKCKTPILFIHGEKDNIVPINMVYELYQAAGCMKRLLIIEGAEHAMSVRKDPDRYWNEVFNFIDFSAN